MTTTTSPGSRKLTKIIVEAITTYEGPARDLERAIGTLMLGAATGWEALYLMQDKRKIKRHEAILGISFRETLMARGLWVEHSEAWRAAQGKSLWRAIRGDFPDIRSNALSSPRSRD